MFSHSTPIIPRGSFQVACEKLGIISGRVYVDFGDHFGSCTDPPLPMSSFSKQIWEIPHLNPSKVFGDPPFGLLVTTDPPFCSPKNQVIDISL